MENTSSTEIRERFNSMTYPYLAPIEHLRIGSTPVIKGELLDVRGLIAEVRAGNQESLHSLLTPTIFQEVDLNTQSIGLVREQRNKETSERKPRGIPIIDPFLQVQLMQEGIDIFCEHSSLNEATGEVVRDPKVLGRLRLVTYPDDPYSPDKVFELKTGENDHATLTLRI